MMKRNFFLFLGLISLSLGVSVSITNLDYEKATKVLADSTDEFLSGTGTEEDPYLISTKYHFSNIRNHLESNFKVVTSFSFLDSDASFSPISNFKGTIDGSNFAIRNFHQTNSSGIFKNANGATFKNLNLVDCNFSNTTAYENGTGILCAYATNCTFNNCYISGTATFNRNSSWSYSYPNSISCPKFYAGSVCGYANDCTFKSCVNNVNISSSTNSNTGNCVFSGGVVGCLNGGSISDATNNGNITALSVAGGIVGSTDGTVDIFRCVNNGTIISTDITDKFDHYKNSPNLKCSVGGIIGVSSSNTSSISFCTNNGTVKGSVNNGGILGLADCQIYYDVKFSVSYCTNNGLITIYNTNNHDRTSTKLGGIIGLDELWVSTSSSSNCTIESTVFCCNNTGNISLTAAKEYSFSAGIVGCSYSYTIVHDCYNSGTISNIYGTANNAGIGGIGGSGITGSYNCYNVGQIGDNTLSGYEKCYSIGDKNGTNCYALEGTSDYVAPSNSSFLTEEQMKDKSNYIGFNFNGVWKINGSSTYKYPTFIETNYNQPVKSVVFNEVYEIETTEKIEPDFSEVLFTVTFNDDTVRQYDFDKAFAVDLDYVTVGTHQVFCKFGGVVSSNSINLVVAKKVLDYITIHDLPDVLEYVYDPNNTSQSITKTGGTIDLHFNNGDVENISFTASYVYFSTINCSIKGYQDVTITYRSKTVTFQVYIYYPESIEMSSLPSKTTYVVDQPQDFSSGKIKVNYSNSSSAVIPILNEYCSVDSTDPGTATVTVSYQGCQTSFQINLIAKTVNYYEIFAPTKTQYNIGDELDLNGGYIHIVYNSSDNYSEDIPLTESMISDFDSSTAGVKLVRVQYMTIDDTFAVIVKDVYTVTFVDYDGTVISSGTYHYGDTISVPSNPTRPSDNTYDYTFTGWDKDVSSTCTGNVTYTAQYSSEYIEYTVTFLDDSGNVISTGTYHYGDNVTAPTPTKDSDNTYSYTFTGWDKDVSATCTGNATYTATFSSTFIEYTVTFVDYDGTVISSGTYHYGDTISVPSNPTRPSDNTYDYTFTGWDKDVSSTCTGNVTYTAQYLSEYTEEYQSAILRDQLISEIDNITNVDLSTYSTIVDIQSRMNNLTAADRAIVQQKLNGLIEQYNNFVNGINNEFSTSERVFDSLFFGAFAAVSGLAYGLALVIKRRFPL